MSPPHQLGSLAPLADYRQFIVAKLVPLAGGRTDKQPIDHRTGIVCSAHDPAVWTDHATAADRAAGFAALSGERHGVGFVLTAADPFACVDIDGALQADNTWSPLALELVAALPGAVCEVSQSGRGLHLWLRSTAMPDHVRKCVPLGIECYSHGQYILLGSLATGTMADDCPAIRDVVARYFAPRAAGTADVPDEGPREGYSGPADDDALLDIAMRSRSAASVFGDGVTFAQLWNADAEALGRKWPAEGRPYDASSADAALAQRLAFFTGRDRARVDRLMRRSGLARDKWNRPDYLPRTVAHACAQQRDMYRAPAPAPVPAPAPAAAAPTGNEVFARLSSMTDDDIRAQWLGVVEQLPLDQRTAALQLVTARTGTGPQVLNRMLREAANARTIERNDHALQARAGDRALVEHRPEDVTQQAAEVEAAILARAAPGSYVNFGGVLSRIVSKPLPLTHLIDRPDDAPPDVPQIEPLDKVAMLERVEPVVVFYDVQVSGRKKRRDVPDRMLDVLLSKSVHAAPSVSALVTHPIVLRDGSILAADGLHSSGLYLWGASAAGIGAAPYSQAQAGAALQWLRREFLAGFEFASQLDADVALAGLLTGVQRRMLDSAPGLAVLASSQSSGKTTLARRVHVVLTGRDMPVSTWPHGDEAEVGKRLLSTLLRSPAMICFDNVPDGFKFTSGALAAAMTSATFEQRILGVSRDASAPTTVLFALTGNNITLGPDEVTRWLTVRLAPRSARPQERRFANPDVVGHALSIRAEVLRHAVGIVAGFMVSGARDAAAPGSRFVHWDRMVRQPLLWAGALDVAAVFAANAEASDDVKAHRLVMWALHKMFGDRRVRAGEINDALLNGPPEARDALREGLEGMGCKPGSTSSITKRLSGIAGRAVHVEGVDLWLRKAIDSHRKVELFYVESGLRGLRVI